MARKTRKLSKSERDELAGIVAWTTQISRSILFLVAMAIAGVAFRALFTLVSVEAPIWIIPTLILAYFIFRRGARWTGGPVFRRRVRLDLEQNETQITEIRPVKVIEIEELEDKGPSYIVKTDSGEWLLLSGQEMLPYKRRGFPWSQFSVNEAPNSGVFFGLTKTGESIPVNQKVSPLPFELARDLGVFDRTLTVLDENGRNLISDAIGISVTNID